MARLPDGGGGTDQAGNLSPTSGGGARHPATAQRQGTDRPVPVPQGHQSESEHRPGEKRLAVQRRVRRRRFVIRWVMRGRGRQRAPCAGDAVPGLSSFRCQRHGTAAAKIHDGETAAAHRAYGQRQAIAGSRGGALSRDAEELARGAAVSRKTRPAIVGDGRAVPSGLCQSHAGLPHAREEPQRGRRAARTVAATRCVARERTRTLARLGRDSNLQPGRRSGADVRAQDRAAPPVARRHFRTPVPARSASRSVERSSADLVERNHPV